MKIGQLSKLTGVPVETIRYYERIGLLPRPNRRPSGFREYDEIEASGRLQFIRRAQSCGFSLRDAGRLLTLRDTSSPALSDVRRLADLQLGALDDKIQELEQMRSLLAPLVHACPAQGPVGECPILNYLGGKAASEGNSGV